MFETFLSLQGKIVNTQTIYDFLTYLQHKPYILVGGQALLFYIEGRTTQDIDLLIDPTVNLDLSNLESNSDFGRGFYKDDLVIDLLYTSNNFFKFVSTLPTETKKVQGLSIQVASPLSLILLKCYSLPSLYRQGLYRKIDIYESDLKGLFRIYPESQDYIHLLKPYVINTDYNNILEVCTDLLRRI